MTILLFEKAACELRCEVNNRPDRTRMPVKRLLELLGSPEKEEP